MTRLMDSKTLVATAGLVALAASSAHASDWVIDTTHATALFSVRHMMVSTVRGRFEKVQGDVQLDAADLTKSHVDISIDVNSVNTNEPKRDAHLKSPDFFDAEKNPSITFKSTKIVKAGKDKYKVTGDLSMHGVTHPATLDVTLTEAVKNPWGKLVRGVSASGKISRKQWGLEWNKALETGGVLVGDDVELAVDFEINQKAE